MNISGEIRKVESKHVIMIDVGDEDITVRQFWQDGFLLGECINPPPIPEKQVQWWQKPLSPSKPKTAQEMYQDAIYKPGDRVVVVKTRSTNLTIGRTYAVESAHTGTYQQYLRIENNKARITTISGRGVRPAKQDEQLLKEGG